MSETHLQAWASLLEERRSTLGISEATNVDNEREFLDRLSHLCRKYRQHNWEKTSSRLQASYENVQTFAECLDSALNFSGKTALTAVLFSSLLAVLQAALDNRVPLSMVVDLLSHHVLPDFGEKVGKYANDIRVRVPLQNIFNEYLECHRKMISLLSIREAAPASAFPMIENEFMEAHKQIEVYQQDWESSRDAAQREKEEEEEHRRSQSMSSYSDFQFANGPGIRLSPLSVPLEKIKHLGRGSFAEVSEMCDPATGEIYARKRIAWSDETEYRDRYAAVKEEVDAMRELHHHHITNLSFWTKDTDMQSFSIFMTPVGEGTLWHCLEDPNFEYPFSRRYDQWFGCLACALCHAHTKDIKHRDIKPRNIILKKRVPYLADFGTAKDFSKLGVSMSVDYEVHGTPNYIAPEQTPSSPSGRAADIFSLGCVFAEMLTVRQGRSLEDFRQFRSCGSGEFPYAFRSNLEKVREWLVLLSCPRTADEFLCGLTLRMLNEDPDDRPKIKDLRRELRAEELVCDLC